jgi:hypothetical protein
MALVTARQTVVDNRPVSMRLHGYAGDPFAVNVILSVAGQPPAQDLTDWVWTAQVRLPHAIVAFQTRGRPDGVELSMGGADTDRVAEAGRACRFVLHGRSPLSSEGYTLIDGHMRAWPRMKAPPAPPQQGRRVYV